MVERAALRMAKRSFATRHPFCQALLCLAENGVRYDLPNFRESLQTISGYALAVSQHGQFTFSPAGASVMLMIEPQKDHVLSSLLQPEAPSSLKVIALQFCSKRPDTLTSPLQQKIWEVAVSQTSSLDTRLAALQLIQNQSIVATEGVFQTSLQTCLSAPRGPLREALMPLIASQVDVSSLNDIFLFTRLI